ncbi:MAG: DNA-processing protein DprA [bacterium]
MEIQWIQQGDDHYPKILTERMGTEAPLTIAVLGNPTILLLHRMGLLCSVRCPGSIVLKTFDAIRELRDAGVVIAGGFHSPMERECLDLLLRGSQPIILCPARSLIGLHIGQSSRQALENGRLLVLSMFGPEIRRTTSAQAAKRNELIAALADIVFIPHASSGGKTEAVAHHAIRRGQIVVTFADKENANLIQNGAQLYEHSYP